MLSMYSYTIAGSGGVDVGPQFDRLGPPTTTGNSLYVNYDSNENHNRLIGSYVEPSFTPVNNVPEPGQGMNQRHYVNAQEDDHHDNNEMSIELGTNSVKMGKKD